MTQTADLPGDVLVFLPGRGEIGDCAAALAGRDVEVLELHGGLTLSQQARVFRRGGRRRVVLSTNVAETSLTIDGIGVVVDSGLVRQQRWHGGHSYLTTAIIAMDSAAQRAGTGRAHGAGRVCAALEPACAPRECHAARGAAAVLGAAGARRPCGGCACRAAAAVGAAAAGCPGGGAARLAGAWRPDRRRLERWRRPIRPNRPRPAAVPAARRRLARPTAGRGRARWYGRARRGSGRRAVLSAAHVSRPVAGRSRRRPARSGLRWRRLGARCTPRRRASPWPRRRRPAGDTQPGAAPPPTAPAAGAPARSSWLLEAGCGRARPGQERVRGRGDAVLVCRIERVHAGRVLGEEEEVPLGAVAREVAVTALLAGRLRGDPEVSGRAFVTLLRERLESGALYHRLLRQGHEVEDPSWTLDSFWADFAGDQTPHSWLLAQLEALGFASGEEWSLLDAEDLLPPPLPERVAARLRLAWPRELVGAGARYRIEYDLARSVATLVRQDKGRRMEPPRQLLPRLPGFAVVLVERGRTVRLRGR